MKYNFRDIVIDSRTGLNPRKNFKLGNGNNNYITIKDIQDGKIVISDKTDKIDDAAIEIIKKRSRIKNGDILFTSIGRVGETAIVKDKDDTWDVNESIFIFTVDERIITQEYFCLLFKTESVQSHLKMNSTGSTFKSVKMNQLEKMIFELPSIKEQKYITETISRLKRVIDARTEQIFELDHLIKSRFVEMFGNPVSNPRQWKVLSLDKACSKLTDGTHFSPENLEKGDYKYITAKNIKLSGFDFKGLTYVTEEVHKGIYSRCNPEYGDVLYIKDGATTGIAMVNSLDEEFSLLSSVALLKQDREIINGYYLCSALNSSEMYSNIRSIMGGAAITRLTITKLKQIKLPIPPIELQNQFADFIQQVDKLKFEVQKSLDEAQFLFDSLMQKYFD